MTGINEAVSGIADPEKLLKPQELADWLGVPLETVYAWATRKQGPPRIRVGRHLRFRRVDVERWLDQQTDRLADTT